MLSGIDSVATSRTASEPLSVASRRWRARRYRYCLTSKERNRTIRREQMRSVEQRVFHVSWRGHNSAYTLQLVHSTNLQSPGKNMNVPRYVMPTECVCVLFTSLLSKKALPDAWHVLKESSNINTLWCNVFHEKALMEKLSAEFNFKEFEKDGWKVLASHLLHRNQLDWVNDSDKFDIVKIYAK